MRALRGQRVVLPEGERARSIHMDDAGMIARVAGYDEIAGADHVVDVGALVISPGLVDTHVHVNEPGRTEWEGFDSGTRAAAAGGITTLVDMPLNSVPATTTVAALDAKRDAASAHGHVDLAFWGGLVPGNENELLPLVAAGVRGFKCFLTPSGVDEFSSVNQDDLRRALPMLARASKRVPLLVHAEMPTELHDPHGDPRVYGTYLATRPPAAEVAAIQLVAALSGEYDVPTHIVHVASDEAARAVAAAQLSGVLMTAETCPHYLTFAAEDVLDGATAVKCAPPIRSALHREALWNALKTGVLALIATDHSPSPPALKRLDTGDFLAAWGGIASLELSLSVVWTGAEKRGFTTADVARWLSERPAKLAGLQDTKGTIRAGAHADFVVWDPDYSFDVEVSQLQQRHKITPYAGRRLRGRVHATYLRGECVWHEGALVRADKGWLL